MPSLRSLSLLLLVLFAFLTTIVSSSPTQESSNGDPEKFQALLSSIDDSEIHEVLGRFDTRFKDGVFHHDRTAVEAVHSEDPAKATELVKLAKQKRQASNSTMITSTTPITTSQMSDTPTSTAGGAPEQTTTTPKSTAGGASQQTTTTPKSTAGGAPQQTTTTPTTTNSEIHTSVIAPSSPTGASAVSSTSGAVVYSESNGALTTAHSMTAIVSYKASTTTLRITTTLPGGSVSTLTSVAVVNAPYTTLSTETAIAAESATGTPSLQTGIASNYRTNSALAALAVLAAIVLTL